MKPTDHSGRVTIRLNAKGHDERRHFVALVEETDESQSDVIRAAVHAATPEIIRNAYNTEERQ